MAQALPFLFMAGTAMSAGGSIIGANSQAKGLKGAAAQYEAQAGMDRASSQRKAAEEKRQGRIQQSRVLALVAASGAGASDPSVINAMANMEGESEYAKNVALFEGESSARGYEAQAAMRRREAKAVRTAGLMEAAGTVLKSGMTMYDRFGKKG